MRLVTDELSDTAREVMTRGFREDRPAAFIVDAVMEATGEQVSERTIARRKSEWKAEAERRKLARERMEDLVGALRKGDASAADMVQALAMETLTNNPDALTSAEPLRLQKLALEAEKLRVSKRALEARERGIAVVERRMELLEAREKRAIEALAPGQSELTDEERLRRVREIYGLNN